MSHYGTPSNLDIIRHHNGGYTFYTVNKIFPQSGISYGQQKFIALLDVTKWCQQEYPNVPYVVYDIR
jgi:hypothetical protein